VPTYERTRRFDRDWSSLPASKRRELRDAVRKFVADLNTGSFRKSLRVRHVEGTHGIFEMSWAPDGRATFQYGDSQGMGLHVIWRRIGTHDVFSRP